VVGSCEYGDEPSDSGATELVTLFKELQLIGIVHNIPFKHQQQYFKTSVSQTFGSRGPLHRLSTHTRGPPS
jgi:hypothetical protein